MVLVGLTMIQAIIMTDENFGPFKKIVKNLPDTSPMIIELEFQFGIFAKNCVSMNKKETLTTIHT